MILKLELSQQTAAEHLIPAFDNQHEVEKIVGVKMGEDEGGDIGWEGLEGEFCIAIVRIMEFNG